MRTSEQVIAELRARDELHEVAPGLVTLRGDTLRVYRALERELARMAARETSDEWLVPPAVPFETLARADYFASFPQWLTAAAHLDADEQVLEQVATAREPAHAAQQALRPSPIALQPAVCYHAYEALAGSVIDAPRVLTVQGTCWRHEGDRFAPLERGWAFTMREIICVGSPIDVERFRLRGITAARTLAARLGLYAEIETANDPFFAPTARGRGLLQQIKGLKHELRMSVGGGRTLAVASFNDHESFFGTAFDIRLRDDTAAASACVAFGVERWLLAFLVAHGTEPAGWPLDWADEGQERSSRNAAPPRTRGLPLYARHASAAERGAWAVGTAIDWNGIDAALARETPGVLAQVREAALIESFHPVNLGRLMRATWDDIDAGVCLSLEAFEGFKHFHSLRLYLETVGHTPGITEAELVALREPAALAEVGPDELIEKLVEFMLSEHLAAYFFRRLSAQAKEPQLAQLLALIAADEVRHAQSAADLIAKRIRADRSVVPRVLEAAASFRHFGEEALGGAVPVAMHGDEVAIRTFADRIERLCGVRLVDHLKTQL
jgi:rubrerythrin